MALKSENRQHYAYRIFKFIFLGSKASYEKIFLHISDLFSHDLLQII